MQFTGPASNLGGDFAIRVESHQSGFLTEVISNHFNFFNNPMFQDIFPANATDEQG
jgi:hypothetical protein